MGENIAIVTDSTSDIPDELIYQYHIYVVNNIVIVEGQSLEDRKEISREEFYTKLPKLKKFPTTATASSGVYQKLYEKLFKQGISHILSIHASSKLSGIYNAACLAAQAFSNRVQVIDSKNVTLGLGFQVIAAAEMVRKGESLETIRSLIECLQKRIKVVAMLDTLEYIRRSGRVNWARARLGAILSIKPFLEIVNGEVVSLGQERTRKKGVARLVEILRNLGPLERLAILHTNAELEAQKIIAELSAQLPFIPLSINVTTVIGSHVGPNGLGFAALLKY